MKLVELKNYSFGYTQTLILKNVDLTINSGEIIGLVGVNGSGKTTLIKSIMGELKGNTDVIINEKTIASLNDLKQREDIFYVSDSGDLPDYLTLKEYLYFIRDIYHVDKKYFKDIVSELLVVFEMEAVYDNKLIKNFSHGMMKKTQIMGALLTRPKLFLIDEPTNGLDVLMIYQLKKVLKKQKADNIAILISSHDMGFVLDVCDHVVFIKDGNLSNRYDTHNITINELENLFIDWDEKRK